MLGDEGTIVGGRVKLGANGTWHAISKVVKLRTGEGHEVELVEIEHATIDPVVTTKADWGDLEKEPGALACVDEAPAPDVTAELYSSHIRGGQRIAAWGEVREHVLDGEVGVGAYRESAKRRVVVMAPSMVFLGDNCVERLERLRATPAHEPLRSPSEAAPKLPETTPWGELRVVPVGIFATVPVVVLFGVLAVVRNAASPSAALALIGAALVLPLASQALGHGFIVEDAKPSETRRTVAMLFAGTLGITCLFALWGYSSAAAFDSLRLVGLAGGLVLLASCVALVLMTRHRRRCMRLIANAPAHADPIVDGVWGALDGAATADGNVFVAGEPVVVAYGIKFASEDSETIRETQLSFHVRGVQVRIRGMAWFSTISRDVETRLGMLSVDMIRDGAKVRVVGRAKGGVLAKGGEQSLLVFAMDLDGDPIVAARRFAWWDRAVVGLTIAGSAGMIAGVSLALRAFGA
ncbi:MAG: hypothetical protein ACKV2T_28320 [Kofleriaceae bacterium]